MVLNLEIECRKVNMRLEKEVPEDFRGYVGEPSSELSVAFLLGLLYDYLPFPFVPTRINDAFPDCEGVDPTTGSYIGIELELLSRNYLSHGHPLEGCDYIVCWRDDWPESPIPVISLEELIAENDLEGKRFILSRRPGSLRTELEGLQATDPHTYEVVGYFLDSVFANVQKRIPGANLDEGLSAAFSLRDPEGKGIIGVTPYGKLICNSVEQYVRDYGEWIREPAGRFRGRIKGVGVLRTREQADQVGEATMTFLVALGYGNRSDTE
jgi:hypothetical protein